MSPARATNAMAVPPLVRFYHAPISRERPLFGYCNGNTCAQSAAPQQGWSDVVTADPK